MNYDWPNTILLDGGMGTMLQQRPELGARPEELNITDLALIESIHAWHAAAGSRIINANTFWRFLPTAGGQRVHAGEIVGGIATVPGPALTVVWPRWMWTPGELLNPTALLCV